MSPDKLVYMANQIGKFFANQGPERSSAAIAEHITKFWDPRMRSAIIAHVNDDGGTIDPVIVQAVRALKPVSALD